MCRSSRQALSKVVSRRLSCLSSGLLVLQAFWAHLVGCGLGCRAVGRDWHGMRFSADWDRSRQQGVEGAGAEPHDGLPYPSSFGASCTPELGSSKAPEPCLV